MTDIALRLKDELLRLSEGDREELADILMESLGYQHVEEDEEDGWVAELNRRADDLAAGRATAEPAEKVFAELREERRREKSDLEKRA